MDEEKTEYELRGTTLKVYKCLLKKGEPIRLTEVQKALSLSSASLAQYHLRKLVEMGLVLEQPAGFVVAKNVIDTVFRLRKMLLPTHVAYVAFFSVTLASMVSFLVVSKPLTVTSFDFLALSTNFVALAMSALETRRVLMKVI
jgi:hypothetical protein